jgi:hypothetical protein
MDNGLGRLLACLSTLLSMSGIILLH